jgi:hypothetical protein
MAWGELGRGMKVAIEVLGVSALVIVGLLNGACGSGGASYVEIPPPGHCWWPGRCREVPSAASCTSSETFDEGSCGTTLRVGACVASDGSRTYLYAPLHGLFAPDCAGISGPGARYESD